MTELASPIADKTSYEKFKPIITIIIGLISFGLFVGINLESSLESWDVYRKWGAPSSTDIFNGSYWGLITSNFLHTEIWHIAFNLYWIWFFGKKIESETNKPHYVFLIITAALISSLAQLGFSDSTGIGLSGIGYTLFGFLFIKGRISDQYKGFLEKKTINLFLIWLVLCVFLTQANIWTVGNAAHIAGLIWGMALAYLSKFQIAKQWIFGGILFIIIGSSFWWNPFATSWLSYQAYELHENQKIDEAILVYKEVLKRDSNNEFAKTNLAQLQKTKLYEKAYKYHADSDFVKAREIYNEILKLDPNDKWAKENLSRLPNE
jgi:membrane associated rhomboid family serine protease